MDIQDDTPTEAVARTGVTPAGMPGAAWYIAGAISHALIKSPATPEVIVREYWFVLTAGDSRQALEKALTLPAQRGRISDGMVREWLVDGLIELLAVPENPADGSELIWATAELTSERIAAAIPAKGHLQVFANPNEPATVSGWYVATIVLTEVHETGSHGGSSLVWMNSYLLQAPDPDTAYARAIALGRAEADESGGHSCNGDAANWEFSGLSELRRTVEEPADGALLWTKEYSSMPGELKRRIPAPEDLSVFEWERSLRTGNTGV